MKAQPAVFFPKHPRWIMMATAAFSFVAPWVQAQTYPPAGNGIAAPGAVQQPYYRQSGSAYVPPGTNNRAPAPGHYQPGFGTPPNYKPPTVKAPAPSKTKSTSTSSSSSSKPVSLETKVARLEKNDARQDQRLTQLEGGTSSRGQSGKTVEGGVYTVRPGDTLWRIADRHNTSINELKSVNRLTGETITVGQALLIPGRGISLPKEASTVGVHIVRPGDTFTGIAQSHGLTMDALARANPSVYPDRLLVGERIVIPGQKVGTTPAALPRDTTPVVTSRMHVVKPGESLGAIAKSYGVSTASMASANKLKNANLIAPGQKLIVPGASAVPRSSAPAYPPADTDTIPLPGAGLYAVAPAPAPAPAAAPAQITPPAPTPAPKSAPAPVSSNRRGIVAYRLERGDDINTVSALFNTTPEKIRELNKMSADARLKEGDEVVVPSIGAVSLN